MASNLLSGPNARAAEAAAPNETEATVIAFLRDRLGDGLAGVLPSTIMRFVRGFAKTENRMDTTLKCVNAYLKFRSESKVDEIAQTVYPRIEEFNSQWQSGLHGISKTGHVIYVQRLGKIDPAKIWKNFTFDEVRNFHIQEMEHVVTAKEELSRRYGQMTYKHVCIMDLDGVGMSHFGQNFREPIKQVLNIDQNMYPETLHVMVIVNYSLVFKAIWKIVSPWIDPLTKARILWGKDELAKYIAADQLPQFLGGKCKCAKCLVTPFVPGDGAVPLPAMPDVVETKDIKDGAATVPATATEASADAVTAPATSDASSIPVVEATPAATTEGVINDATTATTTSTTSSITPSTSTEGVATVISTESSTTSVATDTIPQ